MLLGRDVETGRVAELIRGRRPVAVVGDPGIGKTTVLEAAATASGLTPHLTGCLATLSWSGLLPARRLLGPAFRPSSPEAAAGAVRAFVGDGVLVVDDLQWADPETLDLVGLLAERVALAVGIRLGDDGADKALAAVADVAGQVVEIAPLGRDDAFALVEAAQPELGGTDLVDVVERGGGNPLFLLALATGDRAADTLRTAFTQRLQALSGPARASLERLALLGRPATAALLDATEELLASGLAVAVSEGLEVRHPVIREVVVTAMDADQRAAVHRHLADAVTDAAEAAQHHAGAGDGPRAHDLARAAADDATPADRARLLALAAVHAGEDDADRERVEAADALVTTHQATAALELLEGVGGDRAAVIRCRAHWTRRDDVDLEAAIDEGLRLTDGRDVPERAAFRVWRARAAVRFSGDAALSRALAEEALEEAERLGAHLPEANGVLGSAYLMVGAPECRGYLETAVSLAAAAGDFSTAFDAGNSLLGTYQVMGDWLGFERVADELRTIAEDADLEYWISWATSARGLPDLHLHAAYRDVADSLGAALRGPVVARGSNVGAAHLTLALALLGRADEASRILDREVVTFVRDTFERLWRSWAGAESRWLDADPAGALAFADEGLATSPPGAALRPLLGGLRAWALIDLGRVPDEPPDATFFPLLAPVAVEYEALHALGSGDHAAAATAFAAAAEAWQGKMRHAELRCRWGAGEAHRLADRPEEAERSLVALEAELDALGAVPLLRRVQRSLRQLGHRRSAPKSATDGALTDREREVLALVADGLGTPEIARRLGLGRRTVDGTIESARVRLGATTRLQAALLAAEQEVGPHSG